MWRLVSWRAGGRSSSVMVCLCTFHLSLPLATTSGVGLKRLGASRRIAAGVGPVAWGICARACWELRLVTCNVLRSCGCCARWWSGLVVSQGPCGGGLVVWRWWIGVEVTGEGPVVDWRQFGGGPTVGWRWTGARLAWWGCGCVPRRTLVVDCCWINGGPPMCVGSGPLGVGGLVVGWWRTVGVVVVCGCWTSNGSLVVVWVGGGFMMGRWWVSGSPVWVCVVAM